MLSNTCQMSLDSIGSNNQLSALMRNFAIEAPKVKNLVPNWSLNEVLSFLKKAEPLSTLSLERLTKKTVFLVALATAKRISELQALSPEISFQKQNVILYIKHSFLAKTETAFNKLPKAITLHALKEMKNTSELNNPLCPVRCLLFYLKKIKSLNINPSSLFVAPKDPSKALS